MARDGFVYMGFNPPVRWMTQEEWNALPPVTDEQSDIYRITSLSGVKYVATERENGLTKHERVIIIKGK